MRLFQRLLVLVYALSMGALGADAADHHGQHDQCVQCAVPGQDRRKEVPSAVKSHEETSGPGDPPTLSAELRSGEPSASSVASEDSEPAPAIAVGPEWLSGYCWGLRLESVDVPDPPGRDPTDPARFTLGPTRAPPVF